MLMILSFPTQLITLKLIRLKSRRFLDSAELQKTVLSSELQTSFTVRTVFGYIKMETYIQKVESDGQISVSQEEHIEKAPERVTHKEQLNAHAKKVAEDRKLRKELGISFKVKSHPVDDDIKNDNDDDVLFEETPEEIEEAERLKAEEEALTDQERLGM